MSKMVQDIPLSNMSIDIQVPKSSEDILMSKSKKVCKYKYFKTDITLCKLSGPLCL